MANYGYDITRTKAPMFMGMPVRGLVSYCVPA
jgi:hypothetical protein